MYFEYIFSIAHTLVAFMGMFFNVFLLYLAVFKSPSIIRTYSVLIINFAITDFMACLSDFFVQQRIIPAGFTLSYVSIGICKYFGADACYIGYSLMLHFLSHSLWSLLFSFGYRLYILHHPSPNRRSLSILLIFIYIPSFFQFVSFLWANDNPSEIREILQEKFPQYNLTAFTVTGTKNIICFSALFTILHMTLPITPVYICILIFRKKIIEGISFKGINVTSYTKSIHSQLLKALTYQAAIPGFYLFSVISYAIGQLGLYHHTALEFFTFSSFLFTPILSPLASFIFITPYRNFILSVLFCHKLKNTKNSTTFYTPAI